MCQKSSAIKNLWSISTPVTSLVLTLVETLAKLNGLDGTMQMLSHYTCGRGKDWNECFKDTFFRTRYLVECFKNNPGADACQKLSKYQSRSSWLIQTKIHRDRDRDKIGFHNITWHFSHCNLSCTCTHTLVLYWSRSSSVSISHQDNTNEFHTWFVNQKVKLPILNENWTLAVYLESRHRSFHKYHYSYDLDLI